MNEAEALKIAKDAYDGSTSYVDANYRKQWEVNLRMFQSKHPADSKYHSEAYKYRSKIFRPKTRSAGRRLEAAAAAAFFSNIDVVNVDPANSKSEQAAVGAAVRKALLQHRLTKTIPWFVTLIGAVQDAYAVGVVCSYQYWKYKEKKRQQITLDPQGIAVLDHDGQPVMETVADVIEDEPCIELIAVENLRISPAAKWYDPIKTSPYVIELMPMYAGDVKEMALIDDPKTGTPAWKSLDDGQLRSCTGQNYDSTRQVREGKREDSQNPSTGLSDYEICWIHRNIVRKGGEDWVYYTAGTEHLLSTPQKLKEVYRHGKRPYVMGVAALETHKIYPAAPAELGANLNREINEIVNARLDNVKLVLNKRYIVKRGAQVDLRSLVRNAAGSITLANDPEHDVKEMEFQDVTSSAFQEQDRLNVEHDELLGNFSQSSISTNRKLNETVGGMAMMSNGANQVTEYTIRTITETWVEPVLRQLSMLEAAYETDEVILSLVGEQAELPEGQSVTDEMMNEDITLTVNVGMGATDPIARMNKLTSVGMAYAQIASQPVPGLIMQEYGKELFSAAGFRDGGRFFEQKQDPEKEQMKQHLEQALQTMQEMEKRLKSKEGMEQGKLLVDKSKIELEHDKLDVVRDKEAVDRIIATAQANADVDLKQAQTLKTVVESGVQPPLEFMRAAVSLNDTMTSFADSMNGSIEKFGKLADAIPGNIKEAVTKAIPKEITVNALPAKKRRLKVKGSDGDAFEIEEV